MAQHSQRIFILVIVAVFLLSTIAFTGIIVYQIIGDGNNEVATEIDPADFDDVPDLPEDGLAGTQLEEFDPIDGEVTELEVIDLEEGEGAEVESGQAVTAHYTGAFAVSGIIFESSLDAGEPVEFPLDAVIEGWQEGVPGMREGGIRRIIIPGELAYGEAPEDYEPVPGQGSPLGPLVFDIQLFSVE